MSDITQAIADLSVHGADIVVKHQEALTKAYELCKTVDIWYTTPKKVQIIRIILSTFTHDDTKYASQELIDDITRIHEAIEFQCARSR